MYSWSVWACEDRGKKGWGGAEMKKNKVLIIGVEKNMRPPFQGPGMQEE